MTTTPPTPPDDDRPTTPDLVGTSLPAGHAAPEPVAVLPGHAAAGDSAGQENTDGSDSGTFPDPDDLTDEQLLDGQYEGPVTIRGPLRRLLLWMMPAWFAVFIIGGAISGLLLGLQINDLDPERRVVNLAVVSTVGAIVSLVGQPLGGLLSDRTRTRWGRRTPWIVGGSAVGGAAIIAMAFQSHIAGIALCWGLAHLAYTMANGPLTAVMPDRVPRLARGTFAAFTGLGAILAGVGGAFLGSAFRDAIPLGYTTVAVGIVVIVTLFCVFNPERSSIGLVVEPIRWMDLLRAFWVNPVKHPDFLWAFLGRLLLFLGFSIVNGYSLYLLIDYVGLGRDGAADFMPWMTLAAIPLGLIALMGSGPLSDKIGRRKPFVFAASAIIALGLVPPMLSPTPAAMLIMVAVLGIGFGIFQSVDTALVTEVLPSSTSFAKDLGIINIASNLPGTISPAVAGIVIGVFGYGGLFPVGIVLAILGAVSVVFIRGIR